MALNLHHISPLSTMISKRWIFFRKINISSRREVHGPQNWPCTRLQDPLVPARTPKSNFSAQSSNISALAQRKALFYVQLNIFKKFAKSTDLVWSGLTSNYPEKRGVFLTGQKYLKVPKSTKRSQEVPWRSCLVWSWSILKSLDNFGRKRDVTGWMGLVNHEELDYKITAERC